ncbi:MAG TPA: glycosyltransferase family 2 protein [Verrucomicrobiae bacterium]|nr:glycosyltransferase family 2 protein [Verrucomicrobiae bacterium]
MNSSAVKPTVSFVVTALNEEGNINATVDSIRSAIQGRLDDYEMILVNDGSTDRTGEVMEKLAASADRIQVVHNPKNLGFGGAFKSGAVRARKEYVVRICGDNAVPAEGIGVVLDRIGQADLVIPYIANPQFRSWGRRLGSRTFTKIINTCFGLSVHYYNHCVVFPRDLLNSITIVTNGFAYQAEAVVKLLKAGCSYVEVGVNDLPRFQGESTALKPKNVLNVVRAIFSLNRAVRRKGAIPIISRQPSPAAVPRKP